MDGMGKHGGYTGDLIMAQFTLKITLGNEAMQTPADIADTLKMISDIIRDKDITDLLLYKTIFDLNGNDVGRYAIKDKTGDTLPDYAVQFNEVK